MEEEKQNFNTIIKKAMHANGIDVDLLSEKTGIAPAHIHALIENKHNLLPPAPYVRGYIKNITFVLDLDFQKIWEEFSHEIKLKQSGKEDILPVNRFAPKSVEKTTIFIIIATSIVVLISTFYAIKFLSSPSIQLISPSTTNLIVEEPQFIIAGKINQVEDKITINGSEVIVNQDGTFEKKVYLDIGSNVFIISASKLLGKKIIVNRTITYKPRQIIKNLNNSSSSETNE